MQREIEKRRHQKFVPRLTDQDVQDVCGILDGWIGKLTWEFLIDSRDDKTHDKQAVNLPFLSTSLADSALGWNCGVLAVSEPMSGFCPNRLLGHLVPENK
jgi:hypothetical protein